MPQHSSRRASSDLDAIDPTFPPPSLKTGWDQEKRKKKDKKWSIGGFFRRKKKVSDTDSSSPVEDDEVKKGFLERRRAARKKRNRGSKDVTGSFEHVIINPARNQRVENPSDDNVFRKTSNDRLVDFVREPFSRRYPDVNKVRHSSVSLEGRRGGKSKPRSETNRVSTNAESSSDEENGSSRVSSTSLQKLKGDETLSSKDGSLNRRSRAARTERYKKRLSRDEESLKDFQPATITRISRSDEKIAGKKTERASSGNRWTAKVVYCESSDYDTKYTAKTKSATPSPIQSPKTKPKNALHYTASAPPGSTYVTFPPSHMRDGVARSHQELRSYHPSVGSKSAQRFVDITPPRLPKSNSDMITKTSLSASAPRHYQSWAEEFMSRKSVSYDCNVNSLHKNSNKFTQTNPTENNVLVVQFPISRPIHKNETKSNNKSPSLSRKIIKQSTPPPPPPRDPNRKLSTTNSFSQEKSPRPMSYAFEDKCHNQSRYPSTTEFGSSSSAFHKVMQQTEKDQQPHSAIHIHHRSNSDHHIPARVNSVKDSPPGMRRQVSIRSETDVNQEKLELLSCSPAEVQNQNNYHYFTDQHPRSRKPIHITYNQPNVNNNPYLSDSQVLMKQPGLQIHRARPAGVQNASDFWKQKEQENAKKIHVSEGSPKLVQRHMLNVSVSNDRSRSHSPFADRVVTARMKLPPLTMPVRGLDTSGSLSSHSSPHDQVPSPRTPTGNTLIHNEIGIPVFESSEIINNKKRDFRPLSMLEEKQEITENEVSPMRESFHNPPPPPKRKDSKLNTINSLDTYDMLDQDSKLKDARRESSNLEEALNELEAIYKSLRLGEEGYIEKVSKERTVYENNRLDPSNWNAWVKSRGFESDSSYNYSRSSLESVDSVDSPLKRNHTKRSGIPDRVADDMAYRRLNKKDRPSSHEQEVISQVGSFLLVSPTLSPPPFVEHPPLPVAKNEPDVTLDDVVYRNITHINNSLKVLDPQPPFGIPLGPITPAPNSDYLHVTPKEMYRPTFKPRKTPDVVTDDLAFRNLRKDNNKEPQFTPEDTTLIDSPSLKKKRAVRSLSANLLSIIQKESMLTNNNKLIYNNNTVQNDLEKSQSFSDITNANVVNGQASKTCQVEGNVKQNKLVFKSGDESDSTPRGSRQFTNGISSPLFATSTETLTGSSVWLQDSRTSTVTSSNSSPRLSLTPERRHNDNGHLRKSLSPAKHSAIKLIQFNDTFSSDVTNRKSQECRRSPTADSHSFTHRRDVGDVPSNLVSNQNEVDLLAALARETKEASEQLNKELNELRMEDNHKQDVQFRTSLSPTKREDDKHQSILTKSEPSPVYSKSLPIGSITPHKPVKLNTFCITSNNELENKQTIITNLPGDIEGSKSMTDLLNELTKDLDIDFGELTEGCEIEDKNTTKVEIALKDRTERFNTTNMSTDANEDRTQDVKVELENSSSFLKEQILEHILSTPERQLLSSFSNPSPQEIQTVKDEPMSPNRFPLNIADDASDEESKDLVLASRTVVDLSTSPSQSDVLLNDEPGCSGGCSRDCSSIADEGITTVRPRVDPITLLCCMACAHQLAGLDFLTLLSLFLAIACVLLFIIL